MRHELLVLRVLVVVVLVLTVLSLILDIWIFLKQGMHQKDLKGKKKSFHKSAMEREIIF